MDLALFVSILTIAIRAGTSLVYATIGEIITERAGILNLGVEGMMILGAVTAFRSGTHHLRLWAGQLLGTTIRPRRDTAGGTGGAALR